MGDLSRWKPTYHMIATTAITHSPSFASGNGAFGANTSIVYTKNDPVFNPNREIISNRKATGNAYLTKGGSTAIERLPGVEAPETSFEIDFETASAFIPLVTLFQGGLDSAILSDSSTTGTTIINCYTGSTVSYYAALKRVLEADKSQLIKGAIAQSITISGNEGEPVTMTIDWLGADMDGDASTSVSTWTTSHASNFVMFKDMVCAYNTSGTTIDIIGFDITMSNNAVAKHYNNATIQKYLLGDFTVEGTLRFPWGETSVGSDTFFTLLNAGTDFTLYLWKGTNLIDHAGTTAGHFAIKINAEVDDVTTNADDELANEISFSGIYDGTSYPVQISMNCGVSRNAYWS